MKFIFTGAFFVFFWSLNSISLTVLAASPPITPALSLPNYISSQPVGNLAANFSVNGNGSATLTVPIQVPPGTNGIAPNLSVSYDSHRGNGYLGMGWAVNGLSAITRCSANYRIDGYKANVTYSARDRFCIDGRRLIAVSGAYGTDGSVYHTESETWSIFTAHGTCGAGPCSFTATDKDGNALSFGGTSTATGARILAAGRTDGSVRTWAIDSFTDLNGNKTLAEYSSDTTTGEYYPTRIAYTENTAAGLSASRFVTFTYGARPDMVYRYLGGSKVSVTKLLTSITTSVMISSQAQNILTYSLSYSQSPTTKRSRLNQIEVCDGQNVCWPATSFDWTVDSQAFKPSSSKLPGPLYVVINDQQYVYGLLMDFNGDGIADYTQASEFIIGSGTSQDLSIYIGQSDGSFVKAAYSLPGPIYQVTATQVVQSGILIDVNGDGILDYSRALKNEDAQTEDFDVYLGSATGFTKNAAFKLPGQLFWQVNRQTYNSGILTDMNGDGLPDYSRATHILSSGAMLLDIYKGTPGGFQKISAQLPGAVYSISATGSLTTGMVRDINGDGIADYSAALVNQDAGTTDLKVYVGQSPDFTFTNQFNLPGQMFWLVNGKILESGLLADVNGDGIPDYSRATTLVNGTTKILDLYFGTGSGFEQAPFDLPDSVYAIDAGLSDIQGLLTNWNGDETTRFSKATKWRDNTEELDIYLGSGSGFEQSSLKLPGALFWAQTAGTYSRAIYQDLNGDGLTDFADSVCQMANGVPDQCALDIQLAEGPYTDLISSVTTGFNGTTTISYAPLTKQGVYQGGAPTTYPLRNQAGDTYVVESYANADGRGNSYTYNYAYAGARTDLIGAGWVGYETVTMTQVADGRSSEVTYNQTYPNYGQVEVSRVRDGQGNLLTESQFSYVDVASTAYQALGIHQLLRADETMTHYTNNTADYTLEKKYSYDGYGNILITQDLAGQSNPQDDVYHCSRFANDPASGRYGYWLQTKTARTLAACQAFVSASDPAAITWNASTDLRWSKRSYDTLMNLASTSDYDSSNSQFLGMTFTHDAVGNVATSTDQSGAVRTYAYDATYRTYQTSITSPALTNPATGASYNLVTLTSHEPGFGTLIGTTDPNGNVTTQEIDGFGRVVAVYGPDPTGTSVQMVAMTWQASAGSFYLYSQQRPAWDSSATADWYWRKDYQDGMGRPYRSTKNGLKAGVATDVIGVDLVYDAEGRLWKSAAPYYDGDPAPYTETQYDVYNRPVKTIHPDTRVDTIAYAQGGLNITKVENAGQADARTSVKSLDTRGLVIQTVEPNGRTVNYIYNPIKELLSGEILQEARSTVYTYDSLGRILTQTQTDTGTKTKAYDTNGQLASITNASGSKITYASYDPMGRLLQRIMTNDGGGVVTINLSYDATTRHNGLGHLTGIEEQNTSIGAYSYAYDYDAFGGTIGGSLTMGADVYAYASTYDPLGRVVSATYPNGAVLTKSYLADSNLGKVSLQETGAGSATDYGIYQNYTALGQHQSGEYGPLNLAFSKSYFPVGPSYASLKNYQVQKGGTSTMNKTYQWDAFSDLQQIQDTATPNDTATYGYEDQTANKGMGYLTSAATAAGNLSYEYDSLGNVEKNDTVTYSYTAGSDQIASGSDGSSYTYDLNGNMITKTLGGKTTTYSYDVNGQILKIDDGGGAPAQMVYNHAEQRLYSQNLGSTVKTWRVTPYYEVTQLTNGSFQNTLYVPGPDGLIATLTSVGKDNSFTAKPSPPAAPGNLKITSGGIIKTLGVSLGALLMLVAAFTIQARGAWIRQMAGWRLPRLQNYPAVVVLAVMLFQLSAPAAQAAMIPGANGAGVPVTGTFFYVHDHLGSVVKVLDDSGNETASITYNAYGEINQANSSGTDDFRAKFIDSELDATAGLYHMGARSYSPGMTRFISPDPQSQFASPYLYAGNNPVSASDPNGEFAFLTAMIIGAIVGAYFGAAAVNHDMNPLHWDWKSGKTYAGLLGGAVIGSVGAAAGGLAVEAGAAIGASGGLLAEAAGAAIGIAGQALVGAGENAAYTAMGGGSAQEILESAGKGAFFGAAFEAGGMALSGVGSRVARGSGEAVEEAGTGAAARTEKNAASEEAEFSSSASCSIRQSFVAGTAILMADGSSRAIEDIREGDLVAGFDSAFQKMSGHAVASIFSRTTEDLVRVAFEDGTETLTTRNHPFWVTSKGWIFAGRLVATDEVAGVKGASGIVKAVTAPSGQPEKVYNFEVADVHNYYATTARILVHNGKYCHAEFDKTTGFVTEVWDESELRTKFSTTAEFQAAKRDIRFKARRANWAIKNKMAKPWTRVKKPVRTASKQWMVWKWKQKYPGIPAPSSIRLGLAKIRPHFYKQDVDEYLTRIQGGLTIREGAAWNQGPLNSWVNSTSGSAMGGLSRSMKPVRIKGFRVKFI
ncbi:polymorphic toxin-type HINT domain-containing protein [Paremcibacter congregatus]|uniref:polymorphic toxin-type HINT domain-containing protein n=1 Tax=Paremcibacter congregatus TaxID=2043170 RepID=UPI0030EF0EC5